ncbi:hypothetical protein BKA70DRAFT_823701 [Coprinopsis sp. MPI-PUGE-AT-0042]|nr:hypothetical protein BKA70DRAFT_823701 [Coprinopsis sp. MPI-PUGE-AT-0042]
MSVKGAKWKTDCDEAVEVNQRALIDKVLARYSGDFSVFRELLQNSDDAQAKAVEIHLDAQGGGALIDASTGEMKSHGEILVCTVFIDLRRPELPLVYSRLTAGL